MEPSSHIFDLETEEFLKLKHQIKIAARYSEVVRTPKFYLFYGPTGTGKTKLCNIIAKELGRPIFPISGSDIYDKFVGNSEKNANQLFEEIAQNAPSILFIDEADQLLSSRDVSKNDDTATRVKSIFLTKFEELNNSKVDVLVLCTTNRPSSLDEGFLSRFGAKIHIPLPDLALQEKYLLKSIESKNFTVEHKDIKNLVKMGLFDGFSLRELETAVNDAIEYGPLKRVDQFTHFLYNDIREDAKNTQRGVAINLATFWHK